jgi:crotonobetainyl-CoA:carnitine CoA-transferase CaiB-like acyl-CoA transferase
MTQRESPPPIDGAEQASRFSNSGPIAASPWGADVLATVRVLEVESTWAGALCGRLLADAGADVVKIEAGGPDSLRSTGALAYDGTSVAFHVANAGKRSLAIDPTSETARPFLAELVSSSHVILEGEAPPKWLAATEVPTSVIRCAVTPFGRTGPLASVAASDFTLQALLGLIDTTGLPEQSPSPIGIPVTDIAAALFAYIAIIATLYDEQTPEDPAILDVAAFDCAAAYLTVFLAQYLGGAAAPSREGNRNPAVAPWNAYPTRDGSIVLCTTTNRQWQTILELAKRHDLIDDERYQTPSARRERVDEVDEVVAQWTSRLSTADLYQEALSHRLAVGRVQDLDQLLADPAAHAQPVADSLPTANGDAVALPRSLVTDAGLKAAPRYGADSQAVAADWLGATPEAIRLANQALLQCSR